MGLDVNGVKFLLFARRQGVSFTSTAMLGRQELLLNKNSLTSLLARFGEKLTGPQVEDIYTGSNGYSEGLFKLLGAKDVTSYDASGYERVTVTHDFNLPIPDEHKSRFSVVLDGGTLEHIFNFPQAINNCMSMVTEGGHFLGIMPTNNHSGHGFYQFSPELLFRIFSPENGFELQHLIVFEETANCTWYEVTDPQLVNERVGIRNSVPTMLLVIAKKVRAANLFARPPQQSDYVAVWADEVSKQNTDALFKETDKNPLINALKIPVRGLRRINLAAKRRFGLLNRRSDHFKKLDI